MRTRIALGLFALTLGILANSALAGDVSECDVLTDPEDPGYAPKLYGLCVAWHNANERARPGLADRFAAHAEKLYGLVDFPVPGSVEPIPEPDPEPQPADFECPCWVNLTYEDICSLGAPDTVVLFDYAMFGLEGESTTVTWDESLEFSATASETFSGDTLDLDPGCAHTINDNVSGQDILGGSGVISLADSLGDAAVCLMEANLMASLYNGGTCTELGF